MAGLSTTAAIQLIDQAIKDLDVGPELVQAFDPAEVAVDWDIQPPEARENKMLNVRHTLKDYLSGHLQRMPQVLLVAEDGTTAQFFGWDLGMAANATALLTPDPVLAKAQG